MKEPIALFIYTDVPDFKDLKRSVKMPDGIIVKPKSIVYPMESTGNLTAGKPYKIVEIRIGETNNKVYFITTSNNSDLEVVNLANKFYAKPMVYYKKVMVSKPHCPKCHKVVEIPSCPHFKTIATYRCNHCGYLE